MPRLIGVQAEGSAAISNAFHQNTETITPVSARTIADSISVDLPRDGVRAVRAAKETEGTYVNVSDDDILKAIAELGTVGVFAEPAGATAYAGLVQAISSDIVGSEDPILVLNTGSGLKDVRAAMQAVQSAPIIEPTLEAGDRIGRHRGAPSGRPVAVTWSLSSSPPSSCSESPATTRSRARAAGDFFCCMFPLNVKTKFGQHCKAYRNFPSDWKRMEQK